MLSVDMSAVSEDRIEVASIVPPLSCKVTHRSILAALQPCSRRWVLLGVRTSLAARAGSPPVAEQLTTPHARRIMLEIAAGYQRLAQYTDERTGRRKVSAS